MKDQHPTPVITPHTEEQIARAREGELVIQQCQRDGAVWFPPSTNCPQCLGTDLSWQPVSGKATLWSWVSVHQPYLKAFADETPYLVAYVKLDEGPYLMTTLVETDPDTLKLDQPLELLLEPYGHNDLPMPVFRPAA
jgi:uncharacterized OB-fold protein